MAWSNGASNSYRMGADGKFDLRVVDLRASSTGQEEPSSSAAEGEGPSEQSSTSEEPEVPSTQQEPSPSQSARSTSDLLADMVRVEEISDEGIFPSEDIIDSSDTATIVVESSEEASDAATSRPDTAETNESAEDGKIAVEPGSDSEVLPPPPPNTTSANITIDGNSRR